MERTSRAPACVTPALALLLLAAPGCFFDEASSTISLDGADGKVAVLSIGDDPLTPLDFGKGSVSADVFATVDLKNIGPYVASDIREDPTLPLNAQFRFKDGSYPGTGGTCAATLEPGASCTLVLAFRPTASGTTEYALSLEYGNGIAKVTAERIMRGTSGGFVTFDCSPSCQFGARGVGSTTVSTVTVTNTGDFNVTSLAADPGHALAAPFSYVGGAYPGTGGDCGIALAPAATCTLKVQYVPVAPGSYSDSLSLRFYNGVATTTQAMPLSGGPE